MVSAVGLLFYCIQEYCVFEERWFQWISHFSAIMAVQSDRLLHSSCHECRGCSTLSGGILLVKDGEIAAACDLKVCFYTMAAHCCVAQSGSAPAHLPDLHFPDRSVIIHPCVRIALHL